MRKDRIDTMLSLFYGKVAYCNSPRETVTRATTTRLKAKQRWAPFASVSSLNHSIPLNKSSINSTSELEKPTMDSNISSNTNCIEKGTTQSTQSHMMHSMAFLENQ